MLQIRIDAAAARAAVAGLERGLRTAAAIALTRVATAARRDVQDMMRTVFDRPTPYALRSIKYEMATRATLTARVYVEGEDQLGKAQYSPAELLGHQFTGGTRRPKRLEMYLQRAGMIVPGEFVVPGAGARLDRYGNMSRGQVAQAIAQLRVGIDPWSWSNKGARSRRSTRRAGRIFWSYGGHLGRGAWIDYGVPIGVRPLLVVIRAPRYSARIDLRAIVLRRYRRDFRDQFERAQLERQIGVRFTR